MKIIVILILSFFLSFSTYALTLEERLDPPAEQRAKQLFLQLRCMVCNGESIADSKSNLAQNMRRTIRNQIRQGKQNSDILIYFTNRYGEVILMKPPLTPHTILLWFGPLIVLLLGLGFITLFIRKQN